MEENKKRINELNEIAVKVEKIFWIIISQFRLVELSEKVNKIVNELEDNDFGREDHFAMEQAWDLSSAVDNVLEALQARIDKIVLKGDK